MAERMARQGSKRYLKRAAAAVLSASLAATAVAQPSAPQMPPVSRECQPGAAQMTSSTPLPNVAKAMRERNKFVILAIGASPMILRESGAGGYYGLVENLLEQTYKGLEVEIVYRGVSGELARDAGARIKMEVGLAKPDLVLWQVGTADALARLPVEDFELTMRNMLMWLKGHEVDVVLIGLHYVKALVKDSHYQAVRETLKKVATEQGVLRIGRYEAIEAIARLKSEQGAPMSGTRIAETAYECSAEYLALSIASGLFLKPKPAPKGPEPKK